MPVTVAIGNRGDAYGPRRVAIGIQIIMEVPFLGLGNTIPDFVCTPTHTLLLTVLWSHGGGDITIRSHPNPCGGCNTQVVVGIWE